MGHLTLELILWLLLAFLIGCILGCLGRKLFGQAPENEIPETVVEPVSVASAPKEKQSDQSAPTTEPAPATLASTGIAKRPKGLAAARSGKADELQRISGVGPKLDKTLKSLGFFHFDQIANWNNDEVQWVDEHLRFKGRIEREEWIPQAKLLASGNEAEFNRLYGSNSSSSGKVGKLNADTKLANPSTQTGTMSLKKDEPKKPAPKLKETVATGVASAPAKLAAARSGKADDLQQISGVGPKLEKTLHGLGFYHFDQIAEWTPDEVQWVDENLTFKGRIDREEWIPQCKLLAAGDMDKFAKLYGTGGLKNAKSGKAESGSRTRKT